MNEAQIIKKIELDYLAQFSADLINLTIPRHIPLNQLNHAQMNYLEELLNIENNVHLDIFVKNINTKEIFEIEIQDFEKITRSASNYIIENIKFNLASAIIFIGVYYQEDIEHLAKDKASPAKINTLYICIAVITMIFSIYLIFNINDQHGKIFEFIVFSVGFLAIAYIYETFKSLLPKRKKLREKEHQYLIAEYLGLHLEQTAVNILKLDI